MNLWTPLQLRIYGDETVPDGKRPAVRNHGTQPLGPLRFRMHGPGCRKYRNSPQVRRRPV